MKVIPQIIYSYKVKYIKYVRREGKYQLVFYNYAKNPIKFKWHIRPRGIWTWLNISFFQKGLPLRYFLFYGEMFFENVP